MQRFSGVSVSIKSSSVTDEVIALHGELLPVVYNEYFYSSLSFVIVAEEVLTQKIIGVVTARYSDENLGRSVSSDFLRVIPYCYISTFGVKKDYRGKGIGTALLQAMMTLLCQDRRSTDVVLHVKCGNDSAARLYLKLGFRCVGTAQAHYVIEGKEHDAWVLVKTFDHLPPSPRPTNSSKPLPFGPYNMHSHPAQSPLAFLFRPALQHPPVFQNPYAPQSPSPSPSPLPPVALYQGAHFDFKTFQM